MGCGGVWGGCGVLGWGEVGCGGGVRWMGCGRVRGSVEWGRVGWGAMQLAGVSWCFKWCGALLHDVMY